MSLARHKTENNNAAQNRPQHESISHRGVKFTRQTLLLPTTYHIPLATFPGSFPPGVLNFAPHRSAPVHSRGPKRGRPKRDGKYPNGRAPIGRPSNVLQPQLPGNGYQHDPALRSLCYCWCRSSHAFTPKSAFCEDTSARNTKPTSSGPGG